MLMIRLQRVGRKHEPIFRMVLTDSKNGPKSGKFLEILGSYDARKEDRGKFKLARIQHWIKNGAQLSDTVHNFLIDKKAIEGKKINVLPKKTPLIKETKEEEKTEKLEEVKETEKEAIVTETPEEATPEVNAEVKEGVAEEKAV